MTHSIRKGSYGKVGNANLTILFIELSETTFEDLLKIRDKVGTKIYHDSVLKKLQSDQSDEEQEDDPTSTQRCVPRRPKKKITNYERANRSNPIEVSSKKVDYRHNFSVRPMAHSESKHNQPRDPRFDSRIGDYEPKYFEKNYSFLNSMKQEELDLLRKQYKRSKNEETKEKLKLLIQRLSNQLKTEEEKRKSKQVEDSVKKRVGQLKEVDEKRSPVHVNKGECRGRLLSDPL